VTYARIDENQPQIVKALRKAGADVLSLAEIGKGCPDLLVWAGGEYYLVEIKNPDKPIKDRELTPQQVQFHSTWKGIINVIETPEQALRLIGK